MKKIILILVLSVIIGNVNCYAEFRSFIPFLEMFNYMNDDKALDILNRTIEEYPEFYEAYVMRSDVYFDNGDLENALSDINTAIKLQKESKTLLPYMPYYIRACLYMYNGQNEKAIEDLSIVYDMEKKNNNTSLLYDVISVRAELYNDLQEYDKAKNDYKIMLSLKEEDLDAKIGLLKCLIKLEEYNEVVMCADSCTNQCIKNEEVYLLRMQAHDKLGNIKQAIDDAVKYISKTYINKIYLVEDVLKKDLDYSLSCINTALDMPKHEVLLFLRAMVNMYNYDYVAAIKDLEDLNNYDIIPQFILYYYNSLCLYEIGEVERAIEEISKGIDLCQGDIYALSITSMRGYYYMICGKYDSAIKDMTQVLEYNPDIYYSRCVLGICYERIGNNIKAMEQYSKVIAIDSNATVAYMLRGELYLKQHKEELARADFQKILEIDTIARSSSDRHYALHYLGKDEEAIEWIDKIILSDTKNPSLYYYKVKLLSLIGNTEDAIKTMRLSLEKGFKNIKLVYYDNEMSAIRNTPEFVKLIEEYNVDVKHELPQ